MGSWRPIPLPRQFAAARRSRLVGRRYELEFFERAWARAESGDGQVVLIGGEPGAGKTRLAAEVAGALRHHGVTVLVGAATKDGGVPYQPFVEILDRLFVHGEPGALAELLADAPFDLGRLSTQAARHRPAQVARDRSAGDETTGEARSALLDAFALLFRRLADERPLALILDDLHWATLPTITLLTHVASVCTDTRTLIVATFRTTAPDRSAELSERLADLHRLDGVHRLDLGGLDTDAIAEFVSEHAGVSVSGARASAAILRDRTGGNPFFLRELWADLERRGGIGALRGRAHIPASIGDTIGARLAGLGPAIRETIDLAAVLGETFDLATLIRAGSDDRVDRGPSRTSRADRTNRADRTGRTDRADRGQSIDAIDAAIAVGLIEPQDEPPGRYGFVHALTRQVVIDQLATARLHRLHAQIAEALDRGDDNDPAQYPRLAHHYLAAHVLGYHEEALRYATLAAQQAARSLAYEEAALWFERAATLPESSSADTAESLFGAADNHARSGDFTRAREIYERLASMPDPLVRLRAAMGFEEATWPPGRADPRAADLLSAAIADCGLDQDDLRYVRALGALGRALAFAAQHERARDVGNRAIELARRGGDPATVAQTLRTSLWHGLTPDDARLQLARIDELTTLSLELGDYESLGSAAHFGALASYLLGQPAELETHARHLQTAALAISQPFLNYVDTCITQGRAYLRGDFATAERLASTALEIGEMSLESTEGPHSVQMFMTRREVGGLDRVRGLITGQEPFTGRWLPGMLALYTELGLVDGMRRALQAMLHRDLPSRRVDAPWPVELAYMSDAAADLADVEAARVLSPHLSQYAGRNLAAGQLTAAFGSGDRFMARLAEVTGDHDEADRLFAAALDMDRRMGSTVHVAETLARHAVAVARRGDDPRRAHDLARQARAVAEPIGQLRVLRWLAALSGPAGVDGLTDREREVLRLLAAGLSNREIGTRLYISTNTAANHVRSILTKTGTTNRTQAARYATDHQLA